MTRHVDGQSAVGNASLDDAASRPSKTNCTTAACGGNAAENERPPSWKRRWWRRKNEIMRDFLDEFPARAARPLSVRDDVKIREDAARERHDDGYRAATVSDVLRSFLEWYNGYRHSHLVFQDPEGEEVRAQMPNSHQPEYGDKYYARLKALERQIIKRYENPHVAMLTLTGSNRNENGGWRCPADHLRDVVSSWRPDRGRGVYHTLRDRLGEAVDEWEYALVAEHHKSGYGHIHVAVFADGELTRDDLGPAIDAHVRQCDVAGPDAHDYLHDDGVISINSINPDLDPDEYEEISGDQEGGEVGNVGSYIGEYIGSHGEELFDRDLSELMFRASCWASGTQRVRFSTGANEMIDDDLDDDDGVEPLESTGWRVGTTEKHLRAANDDPDRSLAEECVRGERSWSLLGIESVNEEGAELHDIERSGVEWVNVADASHLDPPPSHPYLPPRLRSS